MSRRRCRARCPRLSKRRSRRYAPTRERHHCRARAQFVAVWPYVSLPAQVFLYLQSEIADVRVGFALPTECRHLAVAGNEMHVVAERPQPRRDRIDQLLMIAARQIASSDGACEKHVADECDLRSFVKEHDVTWRVSRTMTHAERGIADSDHVAIFEPAVRRA